MPMKVQPSQKQLTKSKKMKPTLSVCIPTYSRAPLLKVCLNSLLSQVEKHSGQVECVICDNASIDETPSVLADYEARYPVRVFHNDTNIGVIGNITKIISCHAQGDYIWLIGDDDVVTEGAIDRMLDFIAKAPGLKLIALNVGFLPESERPNASQALGGVAAEPTSVLRHGKESEVVDFEALLTGPCADFTASYSFLLTRDLWRKHFPIPLLDEPFTSVRTTYPHASVIASEMVGQNTGYIAPPSVIVYEQPPENFSWARYHALNTLVHATQLLNLFGKHGVSRKRLEPYFRHQIMSQGNALGDLVWNKKTAGGMRDGLRYLWLTRGYPWAQFKACCNAMTHEAAPAWLSLPFRVARIVLSGMRSKSQ